MESLKTEASRISARVFSLFEALAGLDSDLGIFGVGGVDGDDFGGADGGFADAGVVDDELFALFHAAEVEEGLVVGDAVPGGFAVADEVVEGVGCRVRFSAGKASVPAPFPGGVPLPVLICAKSSKEKT